MGWGRSEPGDALVPMPSTLLLLPADALMKKAFSSSSFNPNAFLTRLLIHMGLLKVRPGRVVVRSLHLHAVLGFLGCGWVTTGRARDLSDDF